MVKRPWSVCGQEMMVAWIGMGSSASAPWTSWARRRPTAVRGRLVHRRMFSSSLGLYPLDVSNTPHPQVVSTKNISRHCPNPLGSTPAENLGERERYEWLKRKLRRK